MVKTPYKVFIKITYTAKFPSPLRSGCSVERHCADLRRRKDQGSGKHSSNDFPLSAHFQTCAARSPKVVTEYLNVRILDAWASSSVSGSAAPGLGAGSSLSKGPVIPPFVVSALLSVGWT